MYKLFKKSPHPALKPFVKEFWYLYTQHGNPMPMSNTPTPEEALYFYPKNPPIPLLPDGTKIHSPDNIIISQSVNRVNMLVPDDYLMYKIIFQTGGFYRLFGIPMTEFSGLIIETFSVLGTPIKELREQISNATTFEEMVRFSEIYLMKIVRNFKIEKHPIDLVLNQANLYQFSLDKLASDACLSNRQFERKFLVRTGVSPKIYQRIVRFNQVIKLKKENPKQSWLNITYSAGYFDQMHLLRDFRQFTDTNPTGFDFENAIIY